MTRLHLLAALLLAIFLVNVQGSEGGLRSLQEDNKEEGDPSEWFGGKNETNSEGGNGDGDDEDGGDASGNNTVAEEATETEAPNDSESPANSNTTTTEEPPAEGTAAIAAPGESENAPDESENAPDEGENAPDEGENAPDEGENAPDEGENAPPDESENAPDESENPEGDDNEGDDNVGDDNEGDDVEETEEEWFEEEEEQKEQETKAPYVPPTGDDPFAKEPDESEWSAGQDWKQESPTEMMHDKNVLVALVCAIVVGVVLALCSAQQVIDNPNGCCASICRCFVKILCFPCKCCCGGRNRHKHDLMQAGSDSYTHDLELT